MRFINYRTYSQHVSVWYVVFRQPPNTVGSSNAFRITGLFLVDPAGQRWIPGDSYA